MQTAGKSSIFLVVLLALIVIAAAIFYPAFKGEKDEKADQKESAESKPAKPKSNEPQIVKTFPAIGQTDVDPRIRGITVTFDRDMSKGSSWTGGGPNFPKIPQGQKPYWHDNRTSVLPVQLRPGHYYRLGINSQSYKNFKSKDGIPVRPVVFDFTTRGGSGSASGKPQIVKMFPANGAKGVDPNLRQISVTFNMPMGGGTSWTGGGAQYPGSKDGKRAYWTPDRKTCVLPVSLKPNWQYKLGINSQSYKNFRSATGIPSDPVVYSFTTGN